MENDDQRRSGQQQGSKALVMMGRGKRDILEELPETSHAEGAKKADRAPEPTISGQKAPASSRKIEANRRNALRSTGPRTPTGKKTVAKNALKHGFFSKWLLIQHPDGKEDANEYLDLCAALREHYGPNSFLEELWLEKIAVWSWRLRRLIRFESGQIALALAEHSQDMKESSTELGEFESAPLSSPEIDSMTDHLFLPSKEELDKLLRYEAMINRQLNHAIAELERLQRRRNEESVPAPISVDISGRD